MKKQSLSFLMILLCVCTNATTYTENFESGTKSGYADNSIVLNGYTWQFNEAVLGTADNDIISGSKSVRIAGYAKSTYGSGPSKIELLTDIEGGINTISFQYKCYITDSSNQIPWSVEYYDGSDWTSIEEITGTTSITTYKYELNNTEATRIRIVAVNGNNAASSNNRRINIDNMHINDSSSYFAAPTPVLSSTSGTYRDSVTVTISNEDEANTIYYTTDGSTPTFESHLYSNPLVIYQTTTVNAIAYEPGNINPSKVVSATYTIYDTSNSDTTDTITSYPSGYYYSIEGLYGADLKTALHTVICQDTSQYLDYGTGSGHTWEGFYTTDRDTITNMIIDMYSDEERYFAEDYISQDYPGFGQNVHIEHCVPKSWWGCDIEHPDCAACDLNHLYPADGSINSSKSNNPLGVVTGDVTSDNGVSKVGDATYDDYSGNVFEPADEYKGDFARSYFYVATAYQNYVNKWITDSKNMMEANTYPTLKTWAIELLLTWDKMDPISDKESIRVNKVYAIQNNRNPFIDLPNLAEHIWGESLNVPYYASENKENTPSSIQSQNDIENIICYSGRNTMVIKSNKNIAVDLTIYSTVGVALYHQRVNTNTEIDIPNYPSGIYIFMVINSDEQFVKKCILY